MGNVSLHIGHIALVVVGILGGLTLEGSKDARADLWSPGIQLGMRFDDSGLAAPGEGGKWIGDITPLLLLERPGPLTSWDIRAERRYDTQESGTLRFNHDVASGRIRSEMGENTAASLEGWYFRSQDLLNPDPEAQLAPTTMTRARGSASLETWRGEAGYDIENVSHTASGSADGRSQSWNATLFPFRSELTRWLIGFRREEWAVAGDVELTTSVGTVGMRRQHSPWLSSELEVGVARVADDLVGSPRQELAVVAGVNGFGRMLGLPFDARVRIERAVETTGLAEIWRPMAGARVGLKWERSLQSVGGAIAEVARRDFVTLSAQDTLGEHSIVSLEGSYRLASSRVGSGDQLETWRGMATVSRDLRSWLRGQVRYSTAQQSGSGAIAPSRFESSRVELSLTAVYQ